MKQGGFDTEGILLAPRLGFAWDVSKRQQDGRARRLRHQLRPLRHRPHRRRDHQPAGGPGRHASTTACSPTCRAPASDRIHPGERGRLAASRRRPASTATAWACSETWARGIVLDVAYVGTTTRNNPRQTDIKHPRLRHALHGRGPGPHALPERRGPRRGAEPARRAPRRRTRLQRDQRAGDPTSSGPTPATAPAVRASTAGRTTTPFRPRCSAASRRASLRRLLHAVAGKTDSSAPITSPIPSTSRPTTTPSRTTTAPTTSWPTTSGTSRRAAGSWAAAGWRGSSRQLDDLRHLVAGLRQPGGAHLTIAGVNVRNRLVGTDAAGTRAASSRASRHGRPAELGRHVQPRGLQRAGVADTGRTTATTCATPGSTTTTSRSSRTFPLGGSGKRTVQLRLEMFNVLNHTQFSGYNLTPT